jgi:hypothetical protein
VTVTEFGSAGSSRDQRTVTAPIFGSRNRPAGVIVNRALRVNRIDWRGCFFDRNRDGATGRP